MILTRNKPLFSQTTGIWGLLVTTGTLTNTLAFIECLLCALRDLAYQILFSYLTDEADTYCYSYFTGEETEAQSGHTERS
jgi:hypothetical protein